MVAIPYQSQSTAEVAPSLRTNIYGAVPIRYSWMRCSMLDGSSHRWMGVHIAGASARVLQEAHGPGDAREL